MNIDDYWKLPLEQYFVANAIIRWRRVGISKLDKFELLQIANKVNWAPAAKPKIQLKKIINERKRN